MESLAKLHHVHQPLNLCLNPRLPSFPKPFCSFKTQTSSSFSASSFTIKGSSSNPLYHSSQNPKPSLFQTLTPLAPPLIKATCATIAAAAFFFMRFQHMPTAIAAPISPSMVEPAKESVEDVSGEEKERLIEEQLSRDPDNVEALRYLMEVKIKSHKLNEAVEVIDRLIEIEPNDLEWPLLKANIHNYMGEPELAKTEFEEILGKDPLRVEAYHGLVMVSSQSPEDLKKATKRVDEAMKLCEKQSKKSDLRDFKLLMAQIRVMESNYNEALKVYQELEKDEPRDFRPYLCQGIIYTLLKKKKEADKQFEKFRRLVPKNHPYKEYFDDNMFATKVFSQKP